MHVQWARLCAGRGVLTGEGLVSASLDFTAPKLGSGTRFKKLSATLAARGASNPDALAAYIGRKRYGAGKFGKLSHGLSNPDLGIYLAETAKDEQGQTLTCPECNYSGPANRFGANGADLQTQPGDLRTPAPSTGSSREGAAVTVKGGSAAHALANTRRAVELAAGTATRRHPVQSPLDVIVARGEKGAVIRHRHGGAEIAQIRKNDDGTWTAVTAGREGQPHAHQRAALMEAVGTWNKGLSGVRPQPAPLQPDPVQTPLMAEYGIPAMRSAAFATPAAGVSDGPRATMADAGGGDEAGENGLTPRGEAIRKKLIAKGFTPARALAFAKNAQKTKAGAFGKAAA